MKGFSQLTLSCAARRLQAGLPWAHLPISSVGHIQIAQVPGRHEPDSPGELNFPYIFELLESLGYTGYVGCEYAPKGEWAWGQRGA